jgi:hypothetical protein
LHEVADSGLDYQHVRSRDRGLDAARSRGTDVLSIQRPSTSSFKLSSVTRRKGLARRRPFANWQEFVVRMTPSQ